MGVEVEAAVRVVNALFLIDDVLIQTGFHGDCLPGIDPVDGTLDLTAGKTAAALRFRIICGMNGGDIAVLILVKTGAPDKIAVHQADFIAGEQSVVFPGRHFHKVIALNPELSAEGDLTLAQLGILQIVVGIQILDLVLGIIVDDQFDGIQNCQHTLAADLQIVADAVFQHGVIHRGVALGDTAQVDELADGLGREASAAQAGNRDQPGIIPAVHDPVQDQLLDITLAGNDIGQEHLGKFDLSGGMGILRLPDDPVIKRPVIFEFQGTDGMGNAFDGVLDRMGEIVHGIDAPLVARIVMGHMSHAVDDRITHIDIAAGHIDPGPQGALTVRELTVLHAFEQVQVLLDGTVPVGIVPARLGQGAAVFTHLLRRQLRDIGLTLFDQFDGDLIHFLEIVGGEKDPVFIIRAQPCHILTDGLYEFRILLGGIGIIIAQVELAAVFLGQSVVEQYALGMAYMQIAIGFGRESGMYRGVNAFRQVLINLLLDKVPAFSGLFFSGRVRAVPDLFVAHEMLSPSTYYCHWPVRSGKRTPQRGRSGQGMPADRAWIIVSLFSAPVTVRRIFRTGPAARRDAQSRKILRGI